MIQLLLSFLKGKKIQIISIAAFLILNFSSLHIAAQSKTVTGKIIDTDGNPVSFASVNIRGTSTGVSADAAGRFSVRLGSFPVSIVVSAASFLSTEKKIFMAEKDSIIHLNIVLSKSSSADLKEVVVTGAFGTKRSARSIASSTADYYLSGKAAAMEVGTIRQSSLTKPGFVSSVSEEQRKSRLLTAGELSDFKKWKLWEGYNNSDFRLYSQKWDLYATERYTVQLMNKSSQAIAGQTVYLVNRETGNILWTAITDNTGKAELWEGFNVNGEDDDQPLDIEVKGEKLRYPAHKFEEGINYIRINRSCAALNKVEIAFVVDATGSMQDEISYLQEELEDILQNISMKDPSIDLNTAAVFYRDLHDQYITKVQGFTQGTAQTIDFIRKQSAAGGGDYPEAMKEALHDAIEKLRWSADARARIIFLVLDAPPHDEARAELADMIRNAAAKGIRIVPVACSGTDKSTEFILRSMALATNGSYIFLTDDSGIGEKHIKPTTDEFKVELLNDIMQRVIAQMCFVNTCNGSQVLEQPLSLYNTNDSVRVYPNPSHGPVVLESSLELKEIFVADFTGKLLRRIDGRRSKSMYRFDLSDLPAGTYLIRYITADKRYAATKLVLIK